MKTAISIPDPLFKSGERLAQRLGMSRSQLYVNALRTFLERFHQGRITQRLNAVYHHRPSSIDPGLRSLQRRSLGQDSW